MIVTLIAAIDENNGIGKNNQLPWQLPADMKRFKALTTGHHVIMGRKSYESMGKALKDRTNIVITRNSDYTLPDAEVVSSLSAAIQLAKDNGETEVWILGGGEIFREAIKIADKMQLTHIHHSFDCDTFFPKFNENEWRIVQKEDHQPDEKNKYEYSFVTYMRK